MPQGKTAPTLEWRGGCLRLIDQTLLPEQFKVLAIHDVPTLWDAIKRLAVRGAPAIGCAAAYGVALAARNSSAKTTAALLKDIRRAADYLATSRPTAVNLFWALDRQRRTAEANAGLSPRQLSARLLAEADAILAEDRAQCRAIGAHGLKVLPRKRGVINFLTHCNAGGLATAEYGTALAVIYAAHEAGRKVHVFADETRPLLQGARLTAWELKRAGIPVTLICDNMAAQVMREGRVDLVVVGADRIAANGDAANKIGTYGVAVLAQYHGVPFYVAAPGSTFDLSIDDGAGIPIEERSANEIRRGFGVYIAPREVEVYNPAFDVTPAGLIAGLITERGVIRRPDRPQIRRLLGA